MHISKFLITLKINVNVCESPRQCLYAKLSKKKNGVTISGLSIGNLVGPWTGPSQSVSSCGLNLQTNHDLGIGDLAICDLVVECVGVHAIQSLDVRVHVATNFVKMKRKKFARNKSSNFDSTFRISLAVLC